MKSGRKSSITRAAESGLKIIRQSECRTHIKKKHPNLRRERVMYWTYKMYNLMYKEVEELIVRQK